MPQLDFSTYTSQLFWLVISFASLYLFTARVTMPRIARIFDARSLRIEGSIKKAEELSAYADKIRTEFEAVLSQTRNQAHENVMQMIHQVSVTTAQRKKDMNTMMMERIQSSEAHLNRQKYLALDDIKTVAETISVMTVEKLLNQKIDLDSIANIMDEMFSKKVA